MRNEVLYASAFFVFSMVSAGSMRRCRQDEGVG